MATVFDKYIGIPFKPRGRDFDGCDCYGLIRLMYESELGIFLPEFLDIHYSCDVYKRNETYLEDGWKEYEKIKAWELIKPPYQKWDILLFYSNPKKLIADHIGICIGNDRFIHTSAAYNTSLVTKLSSGWKEKIYKGGRYCGKR